MELSGFFLQPLSSIILGSGLVLFLIEVFYRRSFPLCVWTRLLWIVALSTLVGHWQLVSGRVLSDPQELNVLLDRSDSVNLIPERAERIEIFKNDILQWAEKNRQNVNFYAFAEAFVEGDLAGPGYQSALSKAEPLLSRDANVILVSDGNVQVGTTPRARILSVQLGKADEKDLWIQQAPTQSTAFLKNRSKISIVVGQQGFRGRTVKVRLKRGETLLDEKSVRLGESEEPVELSFFPDRMGESVLLAEVETVSGELSELNNVFPIKVRTVRDKIRLLHVSGKPSLDLKAWRNFLTKQPDVDLVSFYILRSPSDDPRAKNTELSLIPFPYEDLFSTELEKFDVVVLQNFDFNLYFPPFYLDNLARFISDGGALLMIGGDQGFHRYLFSPLAALMPFEYSGSGDFRAINARVTQFQTHPIVQGIESALQKISFSSAHQIRNRSEAITMASFPDGTPWLSVIERGRGRVVALNSDESWKLQASPEVDGLQFGRLARRVLQFLTFDPEVDPQTVLSSNWKVGQKASLSLTKAQPVDWSLRNLLSTQPPIEFQAQDRIEWVVPAAGVYEVKHSRAETAYFFDTDKQPWRSEWKNLVSSNEKLASISKQVVAFENRDSIFQPTLMAREVISEEVQPWTQWSLRTSALILSLLILLLCADFYLRKKSQWDL